MSDISRVIELYQLFWMLRSNYEQTKAWKDADEARLARDRAEQQAAEQLRAMLEANPSGQLGNASIDDDEAIRESGLL